jgi:hypothetical protein
MMHAFLNSEVCLLLCLFVVSSWVVSVVAIWYLLSIIELQELDLLFNINKLLINNIVLL